MRETQKKNDGQETQRRRRSHSGLAVFVHCVSGLQHKDVAARLGTAADTLLCPTDRLPLTSASPPCYKSPPWLGALCTGLSVIHSGNSMTMH